MGSMIHLSVGRLEIDWGRNFGFTDHSPLFQRTDLAQVPYYYVDEDDPQNDVKTRALYQCTACRRQTSVIAGTIFAATKVPLCTWFRAMYHLTQSKGGISSIELGRRLGVTQTTAWKIKHKLMQAMMERDDTKRLTGRIEVDDA